MTWNSPQEKLINARNAVHNVKRILSYYEDEEIRAKYENILAYWQEQVRKYEEVVNCRKEN